MKRLVCVVIATVVLGASGAEARADEWVLGLELGAAFTLERDDRVDAGGVFDLVVGRAFSLGPRSEISIQLDVPMPPGLSVQLPVAMRWWPTDTGWTVHGAARPILFLVDVCANDADRCPMDAVLEPYERGGRAVGLLGAAGTGYARGHWYLEVSYLAGWARGMERDSGEEPLTGFYHGILFAGGARL